ncbi:hypothetical protein GCM10010348_70970 [Streptomyces anthocyanicus]|nr:hypothetical protein GCM10010348_70970 [Streptomyces anthocyanicus]
MSGPPRDAAPARTDRRSRPHDGELGWVPVAWKVRFRTAEATVGSAAGRCASVFAPLLVDFAHRYDARARADHQTHACADHPTFVDLFQPGRIRGL